MLYTNLKSFKIGYIMLYTNLKSLQWVITIIHDSYTMLYPKTSASLAPGSPSAGRILFAAWCFSQLGSWEQCVTFDGRATKMTWKKSWNTSRQVAICQYSWKNFVKEWQRTNRWGFPLPVLWDFRGVPKDLDSVDYIKMLREIKRRTTTCEHIYKHQYWLSYPIGSMYGIYANIWGILMVNVTIYSSTMDPMGMQLYK